MATTSSYLKVLLVLISSLTLLAPSALKAETYSLNYDDHNILFGDFNGDGIKDAFVQG